MDAYELGYQLGLQMKQAQSGPLPGVRQTGGTWRDAVARRRNLHYHENAGLIPKPTYRDIRQGTPLGGPTLTTPTKRPGFLTRVLAEPHPGYTMAERVERADRALARGVHKQQILRPQLTSLSGAMSHWMSPGKYLNTFIPKAPSADTSFQVGQLGRLGNKVPSPLVHQFLTDVENGITFSADPSVSGPVSAPRPLQSPPAAPAPPRNDRIMKLPAVPGGTR